MIPEGAERAEACGRLALQIHGLFRVSGYDPDLPVQGPKLFIHLAIDTPVQVPIDLLVFSYRLKGLPDSRHGLYGSVEIRVESQADLCIILTQASLGCLKWLGIPYLTIDLYVHGAGAYSDQSGLNLFPLIRSLSWTCLCSERCKSLLFGAIH
jgi:hypothetical protein